LTLTVDSDDDDNIARIVLVQSSWDDPMGGENAMIPFSVAENWENVQDNLLKAETELAYVVENIRIAAENVKATKPYVENFGREIYEAGTDFGVVTPITATNTDGGTTTETTDYAYVRDLLHEVKTYTDIAAAGLGTEPQNLTSIADNLKYAGSRIRVAGDNFGVDNTIDTGTAAGAVQENRQQAFENLKDAGAKIENAAENFLAVGNFGMAAELLDIAADNINNAKIKLTNDSDSSAQAAATDLSEAKGYLDSVVTKLQAASLRLNDAGTKLSEIANTYLDNAVSIAINVTGTTRTYLGDNFSENIKEAATALGATENNVLRAGENLREAGLALDNVTDLDKAMLDFGTKYLTIRSDSVDNLLVKAGDNLRTASTVDLTTAASLLENAASQLGEAAAVLTATAGKLKPANWELSEPAAGQVQFEAENSDYYIAPGAAATEFVFLWKAPSDGTYKFTLYAYDDTDVQEFVLTEFDSIEVDGTEPGLVLLQVTQAGIAENNLAKADNAVLTIQASEPLSDLGAITIENEDIFVGPLTMADLTTTDNITFTYTFTVGTWDDNSPVDIKIASPWATDEYGNENTSEATAEFYVDTRAPILLDNGLSGLLGAMVGQKHQAGTGNLYWVDNNADQTITGNVEDNWAGDRLGKDNWEVVTVTIEWDTNSITADPMLTPENGFTKTLNLSEGLNSVVKVTATDWVGNSTSDNVENIFIDTKPPTIEFNTVAGKTWTDGVLINDSTPEIKVTVLDPGYPTSGLGVARENLKVYLDNNENFLDTFPTWGGLLENKAPWDPSTGVFENVIDNAGEGLVDGTYYIWVIASDNLAHDGKENENAILSFTIDTSKPAAADIVFDITVYATQYNTPLTPFVQRLTTVSISGTIPAAEVGGVIKVYVDGTVAAQVTTTTTTWSTSITLTAGKAQRVEVTLTDLAGNESDKKLYGYFMADASAPGVTITSPVTGTTTDVASIEVTGSVSKDPWEDYVDLTVTIQVGSATPGTLTVGADGSFTISAALAEGPNTITITATDEAGNVGSAAVTVTRTVTPWGTYAIILVIVALVLAAIAIFRKR
jgi:hypothetical protein